MSNALTRTTEISHPRPSPLAARIRRIAAGTIAAVDVLRQAWRETREMQRAARRRYPWMGE